MNARDALQNVVDNLEGGGFAVTILDDGAPRDVTAETIKNFKRVLSQPPERVFVFVHGGACTGVTDSQNNELGGVTIIDYDESDSEGGCPICGQEGDADNPDSPCDNCTYDSAKDDDGAEAIRATLYLQSRSA